MERAMLLQVVETKCSMSKISRILIMLSVSTSIEPHHGLRERLWRWKRMPRLEEYLFWFLVYWNRLETRCKIQVAFIPFEHKT